MNWFTSVIRSFGPACSGLWWALTTQRNLRVHAVATAIVVPLGLGLKIPPVEWLAVILAIGMVWAAELFNTAIEALADRVSTKREEPIRRVKDVAAAAVLLSAASAAAVGGMVFVPRLWQLF